MYVLSLLNLILQNAICLFTCASSSYAQRKTRYILAFPIMSEECKQVQIQIIGHSHTSTKVNFTQAEDTQAVWLGTYKVSVMSNEHVTLNSTHNYKKHSTKVYVLCAGDFFDVHVLLIDGKNSVALFKAVPVSFWGKIYYIMAYIVRPIFQVVSEDDANITVRLHSVDKRSQYYHGTTWYKDGDTIIEHLHRYSSITFDFCSDKDPSGITGTRVKSMEPVGVISGNCFTAKETGLCKKNTSAPSEIAAEMLLPADQFGMEYITIGLRHGPSKGFLCVMSIQANTTVRLYITDSKVTEFILPSEGAFQSILLSSNSSLLVSNRPIQAILQQASACLDSTPSSNIGDPSLALLVATELFHNVYYFSDVSIKDIADVQYLYLLVRKVKKTSVLLDWKDVDSYLLNFEIIPGKHLWRSGYLSIPGPARASGHVINLNNNEPFGCYLVGLSVGVGYMTHLGSNLRPPCEETEVVVVADRVDNDCDLLVDEELEDGIDNDLDGRVDEDVDENVTVANLGDVLFNCNPNTNKCYDTCGHKGIYGNNCTKQCFYCGGSGYCEKLTGHCIQGCIVGNAGLKCDNMCMKTCLHDVCDQFTKVCKRGCKLGFTDPFCRKRCYACGGNGSCAQNTMACDSGCKEGYHGSMCSIKMDKLSTVFPLYGALEVFILTILVSAMVHIYQRIRAAHGNEYEEE